MKAAIRNDPGAKNHYKRTGFLAICMALEYISKNKAMTALVDTWMISHRINQYLLSGIDDEHLKDIGPTKGRSVGEQFAHLHNVRIMWIQAAAPDLLSQVQKIEKGPEINKQILLDAFDKSAECIAEILRRAVETGRVKGFKPSPEAFFGYMIAHEAHHRGQLLLALKANGHMPDKKILYGLWEWGTR